VTAADNTGKKYSCFYHNMYRSVPVLRRYECNGIKGNVTEYAEKETKKVIVNIHLKI